MKKFVQKKLLLLTLLCTSVFISFSQNITNKGKEFWVGYGHHQFMETGTNTQNMEIYLSAEEQPATVTITIDSSSAIPALWWRRTYYVPAYTVISINDPATPAVSFSPASAGAWGPMPKGPTGYNAANPTDANFDSRLYTDPPPAGTGGAGLFRKKGIHIVSDVPIVAYAHIWGSTSSGATMLLPVEAWGSSYVSLNSRQSYASNCYNWLYVIAQKDNTVIEITPSVKTRAQDKTGLLPGVPKTITMMKGQIYQVIGANDGSDGNGNGGTSSTGQQLTGTKVRSIGGPSGECFPIAVFAGSSRTTNPASCGSGGGDNDNQQLFPTHTWGKRYLTAPFSGSPSANLFATSTYKIAVKDPSTVVRRNGVVLTGLQNNNFYTYESSTADYIEADQPIMVVQFMTGGGCIPGSWGDPSMVVLSPLEQGIKQTGFYRNDKESIQLNYLTLVVPTAGIPSLRIDNSSVFSHTYPHPNLAGYTVVVKQWPAARAQCIVKCDSSFTAITYGIGSVESYAYNAGTYLNNLGAISSLHNELDPDPTVESHEFTCVNTPVELSVLMAYQPTQLIWQLSSLAAVLSPATDVTVTSPVSAGTVVVDGIPYYKYTLPGTYTFNTADTFYVSIFASSPTVDNCNNTEELKIHFIVKERPQPDFTVTHTGCTLDTVYFAGQNLAGGFSLGAWNWELPGSLTPTGQNVQEVLAPGTYDIKLTGISTEGCVGDTIKSITVYPKPTATFGTTPSAACFGQPITLSDTSSYAGPTPITTWYWDTGENILNNTDGSNVIVNYTASNSYTVKHFVKVSDLCVSDTVSKIVVISPEALIDFTYPQNCLPVSGVAQFNASATDLGGIPITTYSWDFGDVGSPDNTSTAQNPTHIYTSYGTYDVTLNVVTSTGCAGDTTITLTFGVTPALDYPVLADVCADASPVSIATATVTNGVSGTGSYSGAGIIDAAAGLFDPAVAGPGTHTITYSFTTPTCTETITQDITVNALPAANAGTYPAVCFDAAPVALAGSPVGGTFNGTGVTGGSFDPASAGAGTHTLTYLYTDANGCSNTATASITVNALPAVDAGTYTPVCIDGAALTLTGSPVGGAFSGTGVTGGSFNPAAAGAGTHTLTYLYTDANGCSNSATGSITVNPLPTINAGTYSPVCIDGAALTLTGSPVGGTFSGAGVTGLSFNPAAAGAGTHILTYNYTDANGCSNTTTSSVTVNPLPVVNAGTYTPLCLAGAAITLAGTPAGGTFSGTGVTGNTFDPAAAGTGTHTLTYNYTDANGCSATATTDIVVNTFPTVDAGTYSDLCADASAITLAGSPVGGTFSGPGITGNIFDPATAGAGTHIITYDYSDGNGCSNSATTSITVNPVPVMNPGSYNPLCVNASAIALAGSPAGGTFSGPGVTGNSFDPVVAGAGTHTITYGGIGGCTNTVTTTITVNTLPTVDAGSYPAICVDGTAVTLIGSPAGGTFSGVGITGNSFDPSVAGSGTQNISYSYTDANGCSNMATSTITVHALPVLDAGTYNPICIDGAAITLAGSPAGGTFSGIGITGNSFDPGAAGIGMQTITYSYTDANGCSNTATTTVTVNALPVVNAGTYIPVCLNTAAITLAGSPVGGTFSGTGVTGNSFDPAVAGAAIHNLVYDYTDANGCSNTATSTITVNALPVVNAGTYPAICIDGAAVTLVGSPAGGTFSGPGVTGNSFNPSVAGSGAQNISYSYIDANGCSNDDATTVTVNALPILDAGTYNPICIDGAAVTLAGLPAGGTFSGTGVTGNIFDPAIAGSGIQTITYNYTDANGCSNSTTTNIAVNALPVVNAGTYPAICVDATGVALAGSPAGGTFSGPGVTGNSFNPATAGTGPQTLTYSYTDVNGCSNSATTAITVNPLPVVNAGTYNPVCVNAAAVALSGSPAGGTFSGAGVTGSSFDPSVAGAGAQTLTYNYTDANGCSNSAIAGITVNPIPTVTAGTYSAVCIDAGAVTLTGTPAGGIFSGPGVTGNTFNPATAGAGSYNIVYTFSDAIGCTNSATAGITVNPIPVLNAGTYGDICVNSSAITLTGTPAGGTFSGPGIIGGTFDPSAVGAGTYTITYSGVDGCSNSISTSITVNPLPVVNAAVNSPLPLCVNDQNVTLTGSPVGGTFSGAGVAGNTFNPTVAGAGDHTITYVYTDAKNCTNSGTATYIVNPLPVIDAGQSFVVPEGTTITFNSTAGSGATGLTFYWDPPSGLSDPTSLHPSLLAIADQTYKLTAVSGAGCIATDIITVKILKPVKVPNIFTPNGDNIHDTWVIPNLVDYPGSTVEVFNRYGQRVFYARGDGTPWDGRLNGKDVPLGVYYYVIQLKNGYQPMTGWVTIVR